MEFLKFDLETGVYDPRNKCPFDKVTVYDGSDESAAKIGVFCGATLPRVIHSGNNSLYVVFKSDFSTTANGFKAKCTEITGS